MNEKIRIFDPYDLGKVIAKVEIKLPEIHDPYDLSKTIETEETDEVKSQS
jgi:hypothetical protein